MDEPVKKIMEIFLEDNEKRRERFCQKINKIHKRMNENHQPLIKEMNQDGKLSLEQLNQKIKEELTRTESVRKTTVDLNINENFVATKWRNHMIVRYVTRTEITLHTREIRTISTEAVSYTHLDVYKRQVQLLKISKKPRNLMNKV